MNILDSTFVLGLDSGLCCLVVGVAPLAWSTRLKLALAFGVWDAWASVMCVALGPVLPAPPHVVVWLCCAALLGLAARRERRWIQMLPTVLSLDNLAAGGALDHAIADGVSSATLALLGLSAGAILFRLLSGIWPRALEADWSQAPTPGQVAEIFLIPR
ncbi:hypothetical protein C2L64_47150 [Paraburkholderia hospita]|uniref:Uncharacterized protein n=1 Tax=Paraburkholderia hospita TaxID=169430 RepID=A0AAN1JKV4_9BURK|nr:hypothetical protein [Paraburkholderia hospita]AUT75861.1 hypothetical protein C2L64_47150 [Paraburkholderia hospita]